MDYLSTEHTILKHCCTCGEYKPQSEFYPQGGECKNCNRARNRIRYATNERLRLQMKIRARQRKEDAALHPEREQSRKRVKDFIKNLDNKKDGK